MRDLLVGREAFVGIGVAMVLGLATGAVVKPTPTEMRHGPGGDMDVARESETVADADPGIARYGAHLPSWVLGTDVLKASQPASAAPPRMARQVETAKLEAEPEPIRVSQATYDEPPRSQPDYPSQDGDILAEREWRPPPPRMEELPDPDSPSD